jgi:hypothetical protein
MKVYTVAIIRIAKVSSGTDSERTIGCSGLRRSRGFGAAELMD